MVWFSTAMRHASNLRPLRHSFSETDQLNDAIDWGRRNVYGEVLSASCFPTEIYGSPGARDSAYKLPDLWFAGSYWGISKAAADTLRQFDIGNCAFHPVSVFRKDRTTPVDGEWLCINFGNVRQYFRPGDSVHMREDYIRTGGVRGWLPRFAPADDDVAVSAEALSGPGVWIDSLVGDTIFLSEPIGKALKKAKADKGFFLKRCRVVEG